MKSPRATVSDLESLPYGKIIMAINFISSPHHLTLESQNLSTRKETFNHIMQTSTSATELFGMTWQLRSDYFLLPEISLRFPFSIHPPLDRFRAGSLCPIGNSSNSLKVLGQCYSKCDQQTCWCTSSLLLAHCEVGIHTACKHLKASIAI